MSVHKCNKCNKIFKYKNDYERHKNRKIPCDKESDYICDNCFSKFSSKYNLDRHLLNNCKIKINKMENENILGLIISDDKTIHSNIQSDQINNVLQDIDESTYKKKIILEQNEILKINGKFKCITCDILFNSHELLDKHIKLKCFPNIKHNNIYKFDKKTSGKYLFKNEKNAGNIYIVQNDFDVNVNNTDNYIIKIGITNDLNTRIKQYRCGNAYEPRLHYHFACKDINDADIILKKNLIKFSIKREIYKGDLNVIKDIILESIKTINDGKEYIFLPEIKNNDITDCEYCKKIFLTEQDLDFHYKNCQEYLKNYSPNLKKKEYKCEYCEKIFNQKYNLNKHLKKCKEKEKNEKKKEDIYKKLIEQMNDLKKEVDKLKVKNKNLKKKMLQI
ncbi:Hypothetical protein KVN_LOCUS243 [uncultured virus]|nr:Hypothetical protein KVN_LOCUS243 [uncultured virus]